MEVDIEPKLSDFKTKVWYFRSIEKDKDEELIIIKISEGYLSLFNTGVSTPDHFSTRSRVVFSKKFSFEINSETYVEGPLTRQALKEFKKNFNTDPSFYIRDSVSLLFNDVEFKDNKNSYYHMLKTPISLVYGVERDDSYYITTSNQKRTLYCTKPNQLPVSGNLRKPQPEYRRVSILPTDIECDNRYYEQFRWIVQNLEVEDPGDYEVFISFDSKALARVLMRSTRETSTTVYSKLFDRFLKGMGTIGQTLVKYEDLDLLRFDSTLLDNLTGFEMFIIKQDERQIWELSWIDTFPSLQFNSIKIKVGVARTFRNIDLNRLKRITKEEASSLLKILPKIVYRRADLDPPDRTVCRAQSWKLRYRFGRFVNVIREYVYLTDKNEGKIIVQKENGVVKIVKFPKIRDEQMNDVELLGFIHSDCAEELEMEKEVDITKSVSSYTSTNEYISPLDHDLIVILADLM